MKLTRNIRIMSVFILVLVLGGGLLMASCSKNTGSQETDQHNQSGTQLWTCGMHPEVIVDKPGNCPKCGMKLVPVKSTSAHMSAGTMKEERKILYWQAPMDPTEIYDHPGKSKMGMDLVPVYEDQSALSSGSVIVIDPVTVQNMGVRSGIVHRMDFSRTIRAVGTIDYNEGKLYTISTKISGWIERLYVNYTGESVSKGAPLFEIYSPELFTTQQEYLLALNNKKALGQSSFASIREGAESLLRSSRQRLLYWDIPPSEIARLEKTGEVRKTLRLNSPAEGVVVHKNAVEGAFVKEGASIYQIADLSTVWVYASVYDYEVPWIAEGQTATMELSYLPGETFSGKIAYIYPYLDRQARYVRIRLEFQNKNLKLKPGMYANVILSGKVIPNALVIPMESIIHSGKRNVVFIERGGGKFEPREIRIAETGGPDNSYTRVLSGVREGERVVTSSQFLLDSESRLQEAIQKMLEERKNEMKNHEKRLTESSESMDMNR